MNEQATVTQILDEFAKHGHSDKTGKDWSMSRVGLSNGESVFIFNPIAVGDTVEAKQNGDYKNWAKVTAQKAEDNAKHDELMKALKYIATQNKAILAAITGEPQDTTPAPKASQTAPSEPTEPAKPWDKYKQDAVVPMKPNDEINPNDVPDFLQ